MLEWLGEPWRYSFMRLLLIPLSALLFSSCFLFKKEEEKPKEDTSRPKLVGRVAQIPSGSEFLLIETYGAWKVPDGGLLSSVGTEGRTSNLVATGEKLGQYAAADIRSGLAKVGDSVYYRPIGETADPAPAIAGEKTTQLETQKESGAEPAKP